MRATLDTVNCATEWSTKLKADAAADDGGSSTPVHELRIRRHRCDHFRLIELETSYRSSLTSRTPSRDAVRSVWCQTGFSDW